MKTIVNPIAPKAAELQQHEPITQKRPYHWGWAVVLVIVTLATFTVRYTLPVRDSDLWFHMLYGQYFLEYFTLIPDHTIFSWTPTTNDTIYCTWLPDIFFYLLYKATSLPGLFVFRYLCMGTIVCGCFLYARKLNITTHPLTWLVCVNVVVMSYTAAFLKPEIISFVLMTFAAWNWWHIRKEGDNAWLSCYLFPLIMLIWVNSHGGFIFGAVFYLLAATGELLNTWLSPKHVLSKKIRLHLSIAFSLSFLCIFCTPYGIHYPLHLIDSLMPTAENISYNSKVTAYTGTFTNANSHNFALAADVAVIILVLLLIRNFKKLEWSTLITNFAFAYLYTMFYRTTFYWAPVFLFSTLTLLAYKKTSSNQAIERFFSSSFFFILIMVTGTYIGVNTMYKAIIWPEKHQFVGFGISLSNPVSEAQYIQTYFPKKKIGNSYSQGAYLLWKLWPDNRVFFDARHFPYREWSDDFFNFSVGNNIEKLQKKYPVDLWLISLFHEKLLMGLLLDDNWQLAYYGRNSAIILRKGISLPQDAKRISDDIYTFKNIHDATDVFKFAVHIGDYEVAGRMLVELKKKFSVKKQKEHLVNLERYLKGIQAYQERKYKLAIENFKSFSSTLTHIRYFQTNCYQYLTQQNWKEGNYLQALHFSKKALELVPTNNPYALFNMGIIEWHINKMNISPNEKVVDPPPASTDTVSWRKHLEQYKIAAANDTDFKEYTDIASAILNNAPINKKPELLIPSEPTNKKLFKEIAARQEKTIRTDK